MRLLLLASAGGAIGAGLRFLINSVMARPALEGGAMAFPWWTVTVNTVGGFFMGLVYVLVAERLGGSAEWRTFLATGILGGLTTFSAYSLDMMLLYTSDGLGVRFLGYTLGTVIAAYMALIAGLWLGRTLFA